MVTFERIKRAGVGKYSEYLVYEFYINNKEVSRRFFNKVLNYYSKKYKRGFYSLECVCSRKIKKCLEYTKNEIL